MNIKQFKTVYPYLMKSGITPFIWGGAGIGKTQVAKQIAKESGYNFIYLTFAATEDVGDIIGLQDRMYDENGVATHVKHLRPDWFPTTAKNIIVMDEINRAPKSVIQTLLTFILEKRLLNHVLPPDSHLILLANPPTDEYNVGDMSDKALVERTCHIHLEPTVSEFMEFATDSKVNPAVVSFLRENKELLETKDSKEFDYNFVHPNRRGWADMVAKFVDTNPPEELMFPVVRGLVGTAPATRFVAHYKAMKERALKLEDVLKYYTKRPELSDIVKAARTDQINILGEEIVDYVKNKYKENKVLTKAEGTNIAGFINDAPIEQGLQFLRLLLNIGKQEINDFIGEDATLNKKFSEKFDEIRNLK